MFEELRNAVANARAEDRQPESWRFSPEGWDELRRLIDAQGSFIQWSPGARIQTVMGLPYKITCELPPEVPFELV